MLSTQRALETLQISVDQENSIARSNVPKLMKELLALIVGTAGW
jgi:hypothetical protein